MSMYEFETIADLKNAIKNGDIHESKLSIVLDNDCTNFYYGPYEDENGNEIDNEIRVIEASGYPDIEQLYSLVFPLADVTWC